MCLLAVALSVASCLLRPPVSSSSSFRGSALGPQGWGRTPKSIGAGLWGQGAGSRVEGPAWGGWCVVVLVFLGGAGWAGLVLLFGVCLCQWGPGIRSTPLSWLRGGASLPPPDCIKLAGPSGAPLGGLQVNNLEDNGSRDCGCAVRTSKDVQLGGYLINKL